VNTLARRLSCSRSLTFSGYYLIAEYWYCLVLTAEVLEEKSRNVYFYRFYRGDFEMIVTSFRRHRSVFRAFLIR
jgi:hypothetical protein